VIVIFCPKCGGGSFISDEELVKILEGTRPLKAVIKVHYNCRACGDRFGRLVHENLEEKKRDLSGLGSQSSVVSSQQPIQQKTESEAAEGLRFF